MIEWPILQWSVPVDGTPYPAPPTAQVATQTVLGAVEVPAGSGLTVDGSGTLRLSIAALPSAPGGLPAGAFWNNGGLLAFIPG